MEITHKPTENDVKSKKLMEEFCTLNNLKGFILVGLSNDEMTMEARGSGLNYAESMDCVGFLVEHVDKMEDLFLGEDSFVCVNESEKKKN